MGVRLTKPWIEPDGGLDRPGALAPVPAQLGVFQLADAAGVVVAIGYGGGREPFGLRSAIAAAVAANAGSGPRLFRYEITHSYLSRYEELLMVHHADHGDLPPGNRAPGDTGSGGAPSPRPGRLRPGPAPGRTGR